jgi:hypothetical protein
MPKLFLDPLRSQGMVLPEASPLDTDPGKGIGTGIQDIGLVTYQITLL